MKFKKIASSIAFSVVTSLILAGCSGGDGTTTDDTTKTIDGKVIDAEISGATVFLDLDGDGELDIDEPSTKSISDGSYILKLTKTQYEHSNYLNKSAPLIAFLGRDIRTNKAFEEYLISYIQDDGGVNITPMTTIIAQTLADDIENGEVELDKINIQIEKIKDNLADLLEIKKDSLDKDPIALAKAGESALLNHSLQFHKAVKEMQKAMREDIKKQKRLSLTNYKAIAKEFKKLKKVDIPQGYTALAEALDRAFENDVVLFDSNLKERAKIDLKKLVQDINTLCVAINNKSISDTELKGVLDSVDKVAGEEVLDLTNDCDSTTIFDDTKFADNYPTDMEWSATSDGVDGIAKAFNSARAVDTTVLRNLIMPSQAIWDAMSTQQKALYLLNKERYDRGIKPFEGIEQDIVTVAQNYADLLYVKGVFEHTADGSPWERLDRVSDIKNNRDFFKYAENLYVAAGSASYTQNPIAKAVYGWIYNDSGSSYGHRDFCFAIGLNDNSGEVGSEGLIGIGVKVGDQYNYYSGWKSTIVVMNAFDPSSSWNHRDTIKVSLCFDEK